MPDASHRLPSVEAPPAIVGRERELAAIGGFLAAPWPRVLPTPRAPFSASSLPR